MKAALFLLLAVLVFARVGYAASPPEPTYGTAVVDGDPIEWDLVNDFFTNMYRAGDPDKPLEAKAYLRYDCDTETVYVLVLTEPDIPALAEEANTWVAIGTVANKVVLGSSGNDGIPPDFEWVGLSDDEEEAEGFEASFNLAPGGYVMFIHVNVFDDGASQTASTPGSPRVGIDLLLDCDPEGDPLRIQVIKYTNDEDANDPPGPYILEGDPVTWKYEVHKHRRRGFDGRSGYGRHPGRDLHD